MIIHPDLKRGAIAFITALALILVIALLQRWGVLTGTNRTLMAAAGRARDTEAGLWLTPMMQAASVIGDTAGRLTLLALATAGLLFTCRRYDALWLAATVLGGTLLNLALKQAFAAPRPDLLPHLDIVHSYSFPSGHAAGNFIFFGALAMLAHKRPSRQWPWAIAISCILLIGFSRVWLGVHWPGDVTAGWVEGIGWLYLCAVWLRRPVTRP